MRRSTRRRIIELTWFGTVALVGIGLGLCWKEAPWSRWFDGLRHALSPQEDARRPAPGSRTAQEYNALLAASRTVNLNTADAAELGRLPGIGSTLAQRIVADRASHGPYANPADLARVHGIGQQTIKQLTPYVNTK